MNEAKILVVGAGAVGGYFGARLAQAGRDVTFLVRPARAQALREGGLQILSPLGDFSVTPKLVETGRVEGAYDVILLGLKSYALPPAMEDFAPAVGPQTLIVPTLNGMGHMDALSSRFGPGPVVGGVCRIAATLDNGRVRLMAPVHQLLYGELDREKSERIQALDRLLKDAGFDATLSPDIVQDLWEKWVQLASLGAICCLIRSDVATINATPGGGGTAMAIFEECLSIAVARGHTPGQAFIDQNRGFLSAPGFPLTSSMYRDMMAGHDVEVEAILGGLLAHGEAQGLDVPLLRAATATVRLYQAQAPKP